MHVQSWNGPARRFHLPEGEQVLTLHFLDQPVSIFDYMDGVRSDAP